MKLIILNKQVARELESLGAKALAKLERIAELMKKHKTFALGIPYVRKLEGPLWEIRIKDMLGIARIIFIHLKGNEIIVLHAFRKKTQNTPAHAIQLAKKRIQEV